MSTNATLQLVRAAGAFNKTFLRKKGNSLIHTVPDCHRFLVNIVGGNVVGGVTNQIKLGTQ